MDKKNEEKKSQKEVKKEAEIEEQKPQTQVTYWIGQKANLDIIINGLIFSLSFPATTNFIELTDFASNLRHVINDFVMKNQKQPAEEEKKEQSSDES